jgi:hypothetical protein
VLEVAESFRTYPRLFGVAGYFSAIEYSLLYFSGAMVVQPFTKHLPCQTAVAPNLTKDEDFGDSQGRPN